MRLLIRSGLSQILPVPAYGSVPSSSVAFFKYKSNPLLQLSTVIVKLASSEHPLLSVTVTEYVVVAIGLTAIEAVASPVFHK